MVLLTRYLSLPLCHRRSFAQGECFTLAKSELDTHKWRQLIPCPNIQLPKIRASLPLLLLLYQLLHQLSTTESTTVKRKSEGGRKNKCTHTQCKKGKSKTAKQARLVASHSTRLAGRKGRNEEPRNQGCSALAASSLTSLILLATLTSCPSRARNQRPKKHTHTHTHPQQHYLKKQITSSLSLSKASGLTAISIATCTSISILITIDLRNRSREKDYIKHSTLTSR